MTTRKNKSKSFHYGARDRYRSNIIRH